MNHPEAPEPARVNSSALVELREVVDGLRPDVRELVDPLLKRLEEISEIRNKALSLVHVALAQLRLDMKYLVFDVEATRRERDEARERVRELENR